MKEEEIRKRDVFNEYLRLVGQDIKEYFEFRSFSEIVCPACGGKDRAEEFQKMGFVYVLCSTCSTLFANPRPAYETLKQFYARSPSTSFWVNEFFKPVAEVRREKIFRPRAQYVSTIANREDGVIGDIGSGFGLFLEELRSLRPNNRFIAIEPSDEMADICREKGFDIQCSCLEEIDGLEDTFDFLTAFELLEHLFDPEAFLVKAYSMLVPGGYLLMTTLNGMGFDILLLWEKAKSICPPHHLNFFNPKSVELLMRGVGFELVEISTPGKLDWDIIEGMIKSEGVECGRFWNKLAHESDEGAKQSLQDWISTHNLSSHMRILAKKPTPCDE